MMTKKFPLQQLKPLPDNKLRTLIIDDNARLCVWGGVIYVFLMFTLRDYGFFVDPITTQQKLFDL